MAIPSFLFGGATGETPQSLARKREIALAIMGGANDRVPKDVGEGLAAIGKALSGRFAYNQAEKDLQANEGAATEDYNNAINGFYDSIIGGSSSAPTAAPGAMGSSMPKVGASGNVPPVDLSGNDVYNGFIDTVKSGYGDVPGVTNPYGLAAVAATGRAESGYSPKNAGGTWSDPSQSGQPGTAGGIMSWRGPRYAALAATGDLSPQGQGKFFLNENPQLIKGLNSAKSVEEAQNLMNNAWKFAGYDQPGGESARRLAYAQGFLPKFQGQGGGTQVASLDPAAGMPDTASAYVDPMVTTDYRPQTAADAIDAVAPTNIPVPAPRPSPFSTQSVNVAQNVDATGSIQPQNATQSALPPLPVSTIAPAPNVASVPPVADTEQAPNQVAQAQVPGGSQAPANPFAGIDPRLLRAVSNPFLNAGQRAVLQSMIDQQLQAQASARDEQVWRSREDYKRNADKNDPAYQLEQEYKRAQLKALQNKTGEPLVNAGNGQIYDPNTKSWISPPGSSGNGSGFRFGGNSVEAQSLNGLIESGQLTPDQAQQLGAGKTISGPNGELLFLTPQGIFSQNGQSAPQPVQQQQPYVDLFGDGGQTANQASQPALGPAAPQAPAAVPAAPAAPGTIPLTAPKAPSNEQLNAAGFADRMINAGQTLDQYENQGLNGFDQFLMQNPFVPDIIGNTIVGNTNPDYQIFDRAKRDFINAQLRRESGAVIGPTEFDNAEKQYFPQTGDAPGVIKDKRMARQIAIDSMARSAGPNYQRPAAKPRESDDIKAARDAIAKGAPRDAVIKRLQDAGIDTTGL